jgi:hypothetical protein
LLLGSYTGVVAVDAYAGRKSSEKVIDLSLPLPYLVVSGGSTTGVNAHALTLDPLDNKMAAYRGQSFAVDPVKKPMATD